MSYPHMTRVNANTWVNFNRVRWIRETPEGLQIWFTDTDHSMVVPEPYNPESLSPRGVAPAAAIMDETDFWGPHVNPVDTDYCF